MFHVHLWYDLVKGRPMFNCLRIVHVIVNGDIFLELSMNVVFKCAHEYGCELKWKLITCVPSWNWSFLIDGIMRWLWNFMGTMGWKWDYMCALYEMTAM